MTTPVSSMVTVLVASFLGSFGGVFLKAAADRLEFNLKSLLLNWRLATGIVVFISSSLLYLKGIKVGELTILYPMVSLSYVWTLFWSKLFFKEPFTRAKVYGIFLILLGIVFLALGAR
jgi:drug/metabolite transporter (DMT)-like permease